MTFVGAWNSVDCVYGSACERKEEDVRERGRGGGARACVRARLTRVSTQFVCTYGMPFMYIYVYISVSCTCVDNNVHHAYRYWCMNTVASTA